MKGILSKLTDNAEMLKMNNAPYYLVKVEKCPTTNSIKADIIAWLKSKREKVNNTMLVVEFLDEVKNLKPLYNNYVIDEMVKANNKIVLRLPSYHYELNKIELALAAIKKHDRANNKTFKLQDIKNLLIEVSPDMWQNVVGYVIKKEEQAWSLDNVIEDLMSAENQP